MAVRTTALLCSRSRARQFIAGPFATGQALRTVDAAIRLGVIRFDSAVGGLGGCPFAPGAHGNLATESFVSHLHRAGVCAGIDAGGLERARETEQLELASAPLVRDG